MADAAVSFIVSDALWKLTSSTIQKYRQLHGVEDDVVALRNTLEQIQAVLEDAEVKQRKQKAVETWLKNLRSASLELENLLDDVSNEAMQQRLLIQRGILYRVRAFFSSNHNQLRFRTRIVQKVKDIRKRLDTIAATRSNFNLSHATISVDARFGSDRKSMQTSSLVHPSDMYGRDAEKEMITQQICNRHLVRLYANEVRVYAIWGMGGVGKTTLAQLVYNHEMVRTHFELKCWVHVSEFEIEKLTKGIIESIDGSCEFSQLDKMQVHLRNKLHQKRFLIVLDDVWIKDSREWEAISKPLSCGAEGSVVMVTTRSQEISRIMARVPAFIHEVGCLSEEDSWSLFKKLAFGVGREGEDIRDLEPIGKKIVEKCKGLPLAVKAMGSLMWSKSSVIEWQRVKENDLWGLQGEEVQILPALELSYDDLPTHMKRCFAYCCLFPKGHELAKDLLIQLWATNGFFPSEGMGMGMYTIGEQIFSCLRQRSFFEHDMVNFGYKMHDMMHELARYVMRHDCLIIPHGRELIVPDEVLHLSSSCESLSDDNSKKLRSVRSIFIFAHVYKGKLSKIFEHKYLRVLHFIGVGETALPESIGKLKNLRYLNLSGSTINVLPESIIYLQNLQVLILHSCMELRELPKGMRYLRNLQCLDISNCTELQCMPAGIKELASLQRLSNFIIGGMKGARIGELGDLNLLGCELKIQELENAQGFEDARKAKLSSKKEMISLVISWGNWLRVPNLEIRRYIYTTPHIPSESVEPVLEGLEPNSNLKELEILYYPGEKISPSWMINLKNLVSIKFINSDKCNHISALGRLPALKSVDIDSMQNLRRLHDEDNTTSANDILFPSLEILHIASCMNFISLPDNLPKLKQLTITYCPALRSLPDGLQSLRELTYLKISGCEDLARRCEKETGEDWPKISHVPDIRLS